VTGLPKLWDRRHPGQQGHLSQDRYNELEVRSLTGAGADKAVAH
jgi:hypothetical protein